MANEWHVPYELLPPEAQDQARAIQSLIEELEAVDWYHQRAQVAHDEALRRILEHHRDEEKEHAAMLIEWLRRRDGRWDEELRTYVFSRGDILHVEEAATGQPAGTGAAVSTDPAPAAPAASPAAGPEPDERRFTVGSLRRR